MIVDIISLTYYRLPQMRLSSQPLWKYWQQNQNKTVSYWSSAFLADSVKISSHLIWSPCKIWLFLIILQVVPKFLGKLEPCSLEMGAWLTPSKHTPTHVHHTKFGRSRSNNMHLVKGSKKSGGHWAPWDADMADRRNALFPICVITPDFIVLGQTIWVYVGGSQKIWRMLDPL